MTKDGVYALLDDLRSVRSQVDPAQGILPGTRERVRSKFLRMSMVSNENLAIRDRDVYREIGGELDWWIGCGLVDPEELRVDGYYPLYAWGSVRMYEKIDVLGEFEKIMHIKSMQRMLHAAARAILALSGAQREVREQVLEFILQEGTLVTYMQLALGVGSQDDYGFLDGLLPGGMAGLSNDFWARLLASNGTRYFPWWTRVQGERSMMNDHRRGHITP